MRDYIWIVIAYISAVITACLVYITLNNDALVLRLLIADIAATSVIFMFSLSFRNSSFYDAYWSVAPIILAFAYLLNNDDGLLLRQLAVILLTIMWGVRLTWNWAKGWQGLSHEDWRYVNLRQQTGRFWWPVNFLGIHLFPTLLVTTGAIWLETRADIELNDFRRIRRSREEFLTTGIWGWCRHPNYLGEIGFWVGLFIFGYAAQSDASNYIATGPLVMILLFLFVSIPMIDKKLTADKPGYEKHKQSTLALIPLSKWIKP